MVIYVCYVCAYVCFYRLLLYRPAPSVPHTKRSSDKKRVDEKSEFDMVSSSINSSITSTATSLITSANGSFHHSSLDSCSLSSPPSTSNVFLYEDVDKVPDSLSSLSPSYIGGHSRESSTEKEHASFPPFQRPMASSESLPSFSNHVASDKPSEKKRGGFMKLLSRNSKKKSSLPCECNSLYNVLYIKHIPWQQPIVRLTYKCIIIVSLAEELMSFRTCEVLV